MSSIYSLSNRISLIDGFDLGLENRTGTYLLHEPELTLIESGPSPSVTHVLAGLERLNIRPDDVSYLIVTHIHLDHAGGAGLLLQHLKNAKLVVHPKGAKHLIDPTRLIEGAKQVYGSDFDQLFDPIVPIEEDRIIIKQDKETLQIGPNCELTFYNTPGHSYHHFSIYDPVSNGIFTGDTIGVNYQLEDGMEMYLPSTSPTQFNPKDMLESLAFIKGLDVDNIYFGHFSVSSNPKEVYRQIEYWLPRFVSLGEKVFLANGDHKQLSKELFNVIQAELDRLGINKEHPVYEHIKVDTDVCSMGILDYLQKKSRT